jgi:pyruvate dehydrogenase E1 component alpha subunit
MLLTRAVEERGLSLYKQGRVTGSFYDGRGQEATAVGATFALAGADPVCPLIRDLGAHIVKATTSVAPRASRTGARATSISVTPSAESSAWSRCCRA